MSMMCQVDDSPVSVLMWEDGACISSMSGRQFACVSTDVEGWYPCQVGYPPMSVWSMVPVVGKHSSFPTFVEVHQPVSLSSSFSGRSFHSAKYYKRHIYAHRQRRGHCYIATYKDVSGLTPRVV